MLGEGVVPQDIALAIQAGSVTVVATIAPSDPAAANAALASLEALAAAPNATAQLSSALAVPIKSVRPPSRIVELLVPPIPPFVYPPAPPHPASGLLNNSLNAGLLFGSVAVFALSACFVAITCYYRSVAARQRAKVGGGATELGTVPSTAGGVDPNLAMCKSLGGSFATSPLQLAHMPSPQVQYGNAFASFSATFFGSATSKSLTGSSATVQAQAARQSRSQSIARITEASVSKVVPWDEVTLHAKIGEGPPPLRARKPAPAPRVPPRARMPACRAPACSNARMPRARVPASPSPPARVRAERPRGRARQARLARCTRPSTRGRAAPSSSCLSSAPTAR